MAAEVLAACSFMTHPPPQRHLLTDTFEIGPQLGRGAFSTVKLGVQKQSGDKVALKMIPSARYATLLAKIKRLQCYSIYPHICGQIHAQSPNRKARSHGNRDNAAN